MKEVALCRKRFFSFKNSSLVDPSTREADTVLVKMLALLKNGNHIMKVYPSTLTVFANNPYGSKK